jgi:hypothetical protein
VCRSRQRRQGFRIQDSGQSQLLPDDGSKRRLKARENASLQELEAKKTRNASWMKIEIPLRGEGGEGGEFEVARKKAE